MINIPLFKKEIKSNYKLLFIFSGILAMYIVIIIFMYDPKLGDSLNLMAQSMPQLFAAFGMLDVGSTLLSFMTNYLYGFLLVVFPTVFIILLSGKLMSGYVDKGSIAYLLASPNKRRKIAVTQGVCLLFFLLLLTVTASAIGLVTAEILFPGELDIEKFIFVNIGIFSLYCFISGMCYMFACSFSDTKYSVGLPTGFVIIFILLNMISQVGEKAEFLKNFTPITLFDTDKIIAGEGSLGICVLFALGFIMYAVGVTVFSKRDIPA